jgi:hypothetical protein
MYLTEQGPTPFPDVNQVLRDLLGRICDILEELLKEQSSKLGAGISTGRMVSPNKPCLAMARG